jgi:hypothetical protein
VARHTALVQEIPMHLPALGVVLSLSLKPIPPGTSLLDEMLSGEAFDSVPPNEVSEPPAGSFGEFFAKVEERGAEFQRLEALEPDLIRARKMLDGREILSERAEKWQQILGFSMIRYCSLAKDREIANFAHLVRDTCAAMNLSENRSLLEGLLGCPAFASFEKYSKGLITDDGLREAGHKALEAVGTNWEELQAKLSSGEPIDETDDTTG